MSESFKTPVAIFTFNRPQLTEQLIGVLAQIKPRRILVVSDGPRSNVPEDVEKCAAVRRLFEHLNWECQVDRNYAESNMGSFARNSTGLEWVFAQVEEAIILEDDCIPDLTFFPYCEELLSKYRNETSIGLISGNNYLNPIVGQNADSYLFSSYATTWGWASWRRTWRLVDLNMTYWPEFRDSGGLRRAVYSRAEERYWQNIYNAIEEQRMKNAWDYQLILTCLRFNLLTIVPAVNLVSNVGYGPDGTHCTNESSPMHDMPRSALSFPLTHPAELRRKGSIDRLIFRARFMPPSIPLPGRIKRKLLSIIRKT